ncbi:MAG: hypothetical protein U5R31_04880 [Acidimicrobiia bacterium]|nr:hypothetical protein [Acidimicrobiia bacterium]
MTEPGFAWIAEYDDAEEARVAGATLLESGIVATVAARGDRHELSVMEADVDRSCELLGVPVPERQHLAPTLDDRPAGESPPKQRWKIPREQLPWAVAGYLVVLVLMVIAVFVASVYLFGGDFDGRLDPDDVDIPGVPTTGLLVPLVVGV